MEEQTDFKLENIEEAKSEPKDVSLDIKDQQILWIRQLQEEVLKRDQYIHKLCSHIYDLQKSLLSWYTLATNTPKQSSNKSKPQIKVPNPLISQPSENDSNCMFNENVTRKITLESTTIAEMVDAFISTFPSFSTRKHYFDGFRHLFEQGILQEKMSLAGLRSIDLKALLEFVRHSLKSVSPESQETVETSDSTKKMRHGMLSGFFTYLNQQTKGCFGSWGKWEHWERTPLRPKIIGSNFTPSQRKLFLTNLLTLSPKAHLFASLVFATGANINQVRHLRIEHINFFNKEVAFKKMDGLYDMKVVFLGDDDLLDDLKCFIGPRKIGYVFLKNLTPEEDDVPMTRSEITKRYQRAWDAMNLALKEKGNVPY